MNINFINKIPEDSPHCGICFWWNGIKEDSYAFCDEKEEKTPFFGKCPRFQRRNTEGDTQCTS